MLIISGNEISKFFLPNNVSISDAMLHIDRNSRRGVVVIKDSDLVLGTLTDGDIRKSLIRGVQIESSINDIVNLDFKYLEYDPQETLNQRIMMFLDKYQEIEILPLLDENFSLKAIVLRRD